MIRIKIVVIANIFLKNNQQKFLKFLKKYQTHIEKQVIIIPPDYHFNKDKLTSNYL